MTTGSTVARVLRCRQALCSQVCDKQTLDFGIAYTSSRFAQLPEANQFREVLIEDRARIPEAFEAAERFFRDVNLFCFQWSPAACMPVLDLAEFLGNRGFQTRTHDVWVLTGRGDAVSEPGIKVVHARALRAAFQATFIEGAGPLYHLRAKLAGERLDDPQYDSFVALIDGAPRGRGTLFQVGDIALLTDLSVAHSEPGRSVERALLGHLTSMAKRLAVPHVCAEPASLEPAWAPLLEGAGFIRDGAIAEFLRDPPDDVAAGRHAKVSDVQSPSG